MKKTIIIFTLYILTVINSIYGINITGTIYNDISNVPVKDAKITFRVGYNPREYPTTLSDSNGNFQKSLELEKNFLLQVIIEANGYAVKKLSTLNSGEPILLGDIFLDELIEKEITFIGNVQDSDSKVPLKGLKIEFRRNTGAVLPFLEAYTDSLGEFIAKLWLSNGLNGRAWWKIEYAGYYFDVDEIALEMDSIPVAIKLKRIGSIRIDVNGKVLDSLSNMPINNSKVILGTTYLYAEPDTTFTNSIGLFERSVQAGQSSSAIPTLYYRISAPGYLEKVGHLEILSNENYDLGELYLHKNELSQIQFNSVNISKGRPQKFNAYTLNGRVIFKNKEIITNNYRNSNGSPIIIIDQK